MDVLNRTTPLTNRTSEGQILQFVLQVDIQNLKELQGLPGQRRAGRAAEIRRGADFLERAPARLGGNC